MSQYVTCASLLVATWLCLAGQSTGAEPKNTTPRSVNELSMEVSALQTLYALRVTREQMEKLRKLADESAVKPMNRESAKNSDKYRQVLTDLRTALSRSAADEERIDKLLKELDKLRQSEKPELDDGVEVTDEARERAAEALRLLTPGQVASYVGANADDIADPMDRLLSALDTVRGLNAEEWKLRRDAVSEEVGRLVAGLDTDQADSVRDKVVQLLIMARSLKEEEFKKERPELEKKARQIVGDLTPTDVLRHIMEQTLAELLSNPQLSAALAARLK